MRLRIAWIFVTLIFVLTFLNMVKAADYVHGEILVIFKDDVNENDVDNLLNKTYNLTWLYLFPEKNEEGYKMALVKVPIGQEQKWMKLIEESSIVKYTSYHWLNEKVELKPPKELIKNVQSKEDVETVKQETTYTYLDYLLIFAGLSLFVMFLALLFIRGRRVKKK